MSPNLWPIELTYRAGCLRAIVYQTDDNVIVLCFGIAHEIRGVFARSAFVQVSIVSRPVI
jgi:hypothetical protein